jgi:heptosyltransferase-3
LKVNYPDSLIDLLVFKGTATLLKDDSYINKIIEVEPSAKLSFWNKITFEISLLSLLRKSQYDFGFFLTTQWRLTLMSLAMTGAKTAAVSDKKREGFLWPRSFSKIFLEAGDRHIIERNLDALRIMGMGISDNPKFELLLALDKKIEGRVKFFLSSKKLNKKLCVIHPMSRREVKLWNKEGFIQLIDLLDLKGFQVLLSSGPDIEEVDYLKFLEGKTNSEPINIGGQTSLMELAAIIKKADIFIGLDSVASHIAAGVGTPSVTLFGPTNSVNWKPWSESARIIQREGNEDFCEVHGHKAGKFKQCLCYITPQRVMEEVYKL